MSVVIERKMSKIAEKMAKMQQELAALEAQKASKLEADSAEIRQIAHQARLLSQSTGENMNTIIQLVAKSAGVKLGKISATKRASSGKVVAIKYRDPANAENTWTGRGIAPRWLQHYIANGRNRNDFMV
jgi:DNA-binding protein H-NS